MDAPGTSSTSRAAARSLIAALVVAGAILGALSTTAGAAETRRASGTAMIGIFDDAQILHGDPAQTFPLLQELNARLVRVTLWWGGPKGIVRARPVDATDPADPAYDWSAYDRLVTEAGTRGIAVLLTILGTPSWANGGVGWNRAPSDPASLEQFARAAARRYDGTYALADGTTLPAVTMWMAWNEPNNPVFLKPQFAKESGTWAIRSGRDYAAICNATVAGVRGVQPAARVACGATAPRGNNDPTSTRPSVSPLPFLRAMRAAGARGFDAYAHHPYYGRPQESPSTRPARPANGAAPTAVGLGNIDTLEAAIDAAWGKRMRLWLTEYGYQTNPPDSLIGVTPAKQARYLTQAFAIVRADPRIDLLVWFRIRDEEPLAGWQSGLYTLDWSAKPSRDAFAAIGLAG